MIKKLMRKQKKAMSLMSTLLALVLTIIIVVAFLNALTNMYRSTSTNEDQLERFVSITDYLYELEKTPTDDDPRLEVLKNRFGFLGSLTKENSFTSSTAFTIYETELFYFFSSGNQNIQLVFNSNDEFKRTDAIAPFLKNNHIFFEFQRPDVPACKDDACVCYCNDGPYWLPSEDLPVGLYPQKILLGEIYTCLEPLCYGFDEKNIIFGNRAGEELYVEEILVLIEEKNDVKRGFIPQSMDIVTLIQGDLLKYYFSINSILESDSDFLFNQNTKGTNNYNQKEQDETIARFLASSLTWEGGVVIGGMGYSKNSRQANRKLLEGPVINVILEKYLDTKENSQELLAPNVIGVGLHVSPLDESIAKELQLESQRQSCLNTKREDLRELAAFLRSDELKQTFSQGQPLAQTNAKWLDFLFLLGNSLEPQRSIENQERSWQEYIPCYLRIEFHKKEPQGNVFANLFVSEFITTNEQTLKGTKDLFQIKDIETPFKEVIADSFYNNKILKTSTTTGLPAGSISPFSDENIISTVAGSSIGLGSGYNFYLKDKELNTFKEGVYDLTRYINADGEYVLYFKGVLSN
jgi:hypothetical protein